MISADNAIKMVKNSKVISNGKLNDLIVAAARGRKKQLDISEYKLTADQVVLLTQKGFSVNPERVSWLNED